VEGLQKNINHVSVHRICYVVGHAEGVYPQSPFGNRQWPEKKIVPPWGGKVDVRPFRGHTRKKGGGGEELGLKASTPRGAVGSGFLKNRQNNRGGGKQSWKDER